VVDKLKQAKISQFNFRKTKKEATPSDLHRSKDHQEQDDSKTAKGQKNNNKQCIPNNTTISQSNK